MHHWKSIVPKKCDLNKLITCNENTVLDCYLINQYILSSLTDNRINKFNLQTIKSQPT